MPPDHERRNKLNQESLLQRIAHTVVIGIGGGLLLRLLGGRIAQYRGG
jgi:hypothetical protein